MSNAHSLLTEGERRRILAEWYATSTGYPRDACIHDLFAAQAARTPNAVAVIHGHAHLTYARLDRRANQLAHRLHALGVGPNARVGICMERSLEMAVGVLGILKAGGAYVPLDPAYPPERLAFMLADAAAQMLVTQEASATRPPAHVGHVVLLPPTEAAGDGDASREPWSGVAAGNPAYVIYTSGSTGTPKGVLMGHRPLVNLICWQARMDEAIGAAPERTLQFAPLSFDVSFQEMFTTWCGGGALVLIDEETRRDPAALLRLLDEQRIDRLFLPFVALQQLAEAAASCPVLPAGLRQIITAGEQLRITPRIAALLRRLPACTLHNHYGPSESHVVTAHTLHGTPDAWPALPPIGRPIANTRIYLLDQNGQPAPAGVPGELSIGGECLALGYLDRPDLTAERFVPDPFADAPGARLYRTGDLARYLPDGAIEYLGRLDQQVKVRGYRIEPGEIEVVLGRYPGVRDVAVLAREDRPGDKRLVAYVVGAPPEIVDLDALRAFLGARLPDYMAPTHFVSLQALPLTPSGKLDRRALPAPETVRHVPASDVRPDTATEERLAAIWRQVFDLEQIGMHESFFALGGHSLLATQILARCRDAFGVEMPPRTLFEQPTVAGLAAVIEAAGGTVTATPSPLTPIPRDRDLPLSSQQRRLWFLDQLEPDNTRYNTPRAIEITGPLDVEALQLSLSGIVCRHEVLRTTYQARAGQPFQVVAPPAPVPLPVVDLRRLDARARAAEVDQRGRDDAARPFDLARGPLLRALLLRLADAEHLLLLNLHHILCDEWSLGILYREMAALYGATCREAAPPLPALPLQYADYAHWQQAWLQGAEPARRLGYWRRQLAGVPTLPALPTDRPRPAVQGMGGARAGITVPRPVVERLKAAAQAEGCTLFMAVLAAFQALLARWSGVEEILVGVSVANRTRVETEDLIGFFANTLVLRTDLGGDPSFRALLRRVREVTLAAFAHQDVPFEKLVEALRPPRSLSHTPLFQVQFVMANEPTAPPALPGLRTRLMAARDEPAKFDLSLYITEDTSGLQADLVYNTDLFDAATIARALRRYATLLHGAAEHVDTRLSSIVLDHEEESRGVTMEHKEGAQSSFKRFAGMKATPVRLSQEQLTRTGRLQPDQDLPFVVEPAGEALDLVNWARENRAAIAEMLAAHRAVLFRGFAVGSTTSFEQFATTIAARLVDYTEGSTPRTKLEGKVYTSTEFPADQSIPLHNEMSYTRQWPMKIWFFCVKAATQGGETPIADSRRVLTLLDPALTARFAQKQVLYVRNFGTGIDLSWQAAFQTSDRDEVEQYCRQAGIETAWLEGDRLRTRQVCQAIATHPRTGEAVWFNQAHLFHISSLKPAVRESLLATFKPEDLPRNAYYGDGSPIEDSALEAIRAAYAQATVAFPWRESDVLMLDNMSVAHGRAPFSGARKVVVAMAEPFERREAD